MAETDSRPPLLSRVSRAFSTGDFAGARLLARQSLAQDASSYEARVYAPIMPAGAGLRVSD